MFYSYAQEKKSSNHNSEYADNFVKIDERKFSAFKMYFPF